MIYLKKIVEKLKKKKNSDKVKINHYKCVSVHKSDRMILFFCFFLFRKKLQIRYFFRSSSQKTENSTIAFTETMAAKSIMEVDNPSENSRRNNSSRSNRSFHNNSKQTAEKCKQEDEEKSIKYEDSHNSRGKQSFGDRSPRVSSNSKQTSIASRSTVSQSFQNIAFSWIFFDLPFSKGFFFL